MNLSWGNYPTIPQILPPRNSALGSRALTLTVCELAPVPREHETAYFWFYAGNKDLVATY